MSAERVPALIGGRTLEPDDEELEELFHRVLKGERGA